MFRIPALGAIAIALAVTLATAQQKKPSPDAFAATQIGGRYVNPDQVYVGGSWIDISYGAPIKRGRDLWGSGDSYGRRLKAGAPVWRAGADVSTWDRTMATVPFTVRAE